MRISEEKSSLLKELSYDSKSKTMTVTYREDSARFAYSGITEGLYNAIKRAKRPGEAWASIRSIYPHERIN